MIFCPSHVEKLKEKAEIANLFAATSVRAHNSRSVCALTRGYELRGPRNKLIEWNICQCSENGNIRTT